MATRTVVGLTPTPSRPEEGLHHRLGNLATRLANDLDRLYALTVALQSLGTVLVESVEASEQGLAIELLAVDSKQLCERLSSAIHQDLRPMVEEVPHG